MTTTTAAIFKGINATVSNPSGELTTAELKRVLSDPSSFAEASNAAVSGLKVIKDQLTSLGKIVENEEKATAERYQNSLRAYLQPHTKEEPKPILNPTPGEGLKAKLPSPE